MRGLLYWMVGFGLVLFAGVLYVGYDLRYWCVCLVLFGIVLFAAFVVCLILVLFAIAGWFGLWLFGLFCLVYCLLVTDLLFWVDLSWFVVWVLCWWWVVSCCLFGWVVFDVACYCLCC